jgi:hypothetical protein
VKSAADEGDVESFSLVFLTDVLSFSDSCFRVWVIDGSAGMDFPLSSVSVKTSI